MMEYIIENKDWIFSGIGVLVISILASVVISVFKRKKQIRNHNTINRKVVQHGEKSQYIEKIEGDFTIN